MIDTDRPAFGALLLRLDTAYEKKASALRAAEYWDQLKDIPIGLLTDAVSQHIRDARTFPRISDLRSAADKLADNRDTSRPLLLPAAPAREPETDAHGLPVYHYHCSNCHDTGLEFLPDDPKRQPTVRPCHCARTNPKLQPVKRYASKNTDVRRPW